MKIRVFSLLLILLTLGQMVSAQEGKPWSVVIAPDNSFEFSFFRDGEDLGKWGFGGWAPNWGWRGFGANKPGANGVLDVTAPFEVNKAAGEVIYVNLKARKTGPREITFQYLLTADKDVPLTLLMASFNPAGGLKDGDAVFSVAGGQEARWPASFAGIRVADRVSKLSLNSTKRGVTEFNFDPPVNFRTDNQLRIALAQDLFPAGTKAFTIKMSLPEPVQFLTGADDIARYTKLLPEADWFAFKPSNDVGPSALGFENWLEKPAGKRGGVRQVGDHFEFEDKTPVKFWGTNLSFAGTAPQKNIADLTAARFAKWGVNSVRLHKFQGVGWAGIGDANDGTKTDPAGLDRLDYFSSQLTKSGVYYGWSHTFKFEVRPGNRDRLLAYDEIQRNLKGDTYTFVNIAEDVQDLMIEFVVNLLKHRNPYTGKTYAQDPALAFVELQNEDNIFFYTSEQAINACPTYKKRLLERYAEWLAAKYGTTEGLRTAWGDALRGNETLDAKNIGLQANPWFFGSDNLPRVTGGQRQRLLDNAAFFHDIQNRFYSRFAKAIRDAGYQGPLIGSPWQAPTMLPHLYNLKSDAMVGYVDRHNYFGAKISDSMMSEPGSGLLSTGLQQVAGRPFGVSEWIHPYPAMYGAEGPPMMAAYGLGLQGWDASYEFNSEATETTFSPIVGKFPWGLWYVDTPAQLGQFPVLARMVARGDVKQGEVISTRRVSAKNLSEGKFDFAENVSQQHDIKAFDGNVPAASLAAGRVLLEFGDGSKGSELPEMGRYQQGRVVRSNTGQLRWDASEKGYFTIDTAGTKGVVGFAADKVCELGDVKLTPRSPFASLLVTAKEQGSDLGNAKRALVSAVARNSNSGMKYFELELRVLESGTGPILVEPVKAEIEFTKRTVTAVNVLDHDGKATGRTVPVHGGKFMIDGARDKAIWYEVVF